ncbi:cell wall hydrolase [Faecalicatena contorta]|uniref:N-acetylmuramoyl-L-alanine amidase n=1 Tax=Faecalicatena contorta TaxID=39482 RepID=A0A316A014_9FIRM|nr:cell wall hydrolase [Faecalicatena contorta]PWJ51266.1 N-acetylmuramoyl-L-alanine amidase [Faecalicatena contorta]SUQ12822.1 N-acetylmuramoyl-L-alanine amidase [Faecalicatena contorta]
MLQGKKFMAVLTSVTVCTLFAAGFTAHAASLMPEAVTIESLDKGNRNTILAETAESIPATGTIETKKAAKEAKAAYEEEQKKEEQRKIEEQKKKEEEARLAAEEAQRAAEAAAEAEAAAVEAAAAEAASVPVMAGEQELLAAIIFCEAGNQPYDGQVAVGAVIMNRVNSGVYPGSISEVIYQPGQFGPAMTGWLDSVLASGGYTDTAMQAAADALAGANPIGDCLYFGNGDYGIQIGDHFFH